MTPDDACSEDDVAREQNLEPESREVSRLTEAEENQKNMAKTQGRAAVGRVACGVCDEDMEQDTRQPVALPACGHTFCRRCLTKLFHTHGQHFRCPTCRTAHQGEDVARLPVNYLVLSLISTSQNTKVPNAASDKTDEQERQDISSSSSPEPLLNIPAYQMEMRTISRAPEGGVKERDTSSQHSSLSLDDDKQDILRGHDEDDGKGSTMRRGCQLSGRQKICFLLCGVILVLVALGAGVAIASAPAILNQLGFTEKGVARGTYASSLMSSTARANNGTIPHDSMVAWLQTAGHTGLSSEHKSYFGLTGAGVGLATAVVMVLIGGLVVAVVWGGGKRRRANNSPSLSP